MDNNTIMIIIVVFLAFMMINKNSCRENFASCVGNKVGNGTHKGKKCQVAYDEMKNWNGRDDWCKNIKGCKLVDPNAKKSSNTIDKCSIKFPEKRNRERKVHEIYQKVYGTNDCANKCMRQYYVHGYPNVNIEQHMRRFKNESDTNYKNRILNNPCGNNDMSDGKADNRRALCKKEIQRIWPCPKRWDYDGAKGSEPSYQTNMPGHLAPGKMDTIPISTPAPAPSPSPSPSPSSSSSQRRGKSNFCGDNTVIGKKCMNQCSGKANINCEMNCEREGKIKNNFKCTR